MTSFFIFEFHNFFFIARKFFLIVARKIFILAKKIFFCKSVPGCCMHLQKIFIHLLRKTIFYKMSQVNVPGPHYYSSLLIGYYNAIYQNRPEHPLILSSLIIMCMIVSFHTFCPCGQFHKKMLSEYNQKNVNVYDSFFSYLLSLWAFHWALSLLQSSEKRRYLHDVSKAP